MRPLFKLGLSLAMLFLAGTAVAGSRYAVLPLLGGDVPAGTLQAAKAHADELIASCEQADEEITDCLSRRQLVQRSLGRSLVAVVGNHLPADTARQFADVDGKMLQAIKSRRSKCSRFGADQPVEAAKCKLLQYVQRNALLQLSLNRARGLVETGGEPVPVTADPYAEMSIFGGRMPQSYEKELDKLLLRIADCNGTTGIRRKICLHAEMSGIAGVGNDDLAELLIELPDSQAERLSRIDGEFLESIRSGKGECADTHTVDLEDPQAEQFIACVIPALAHRAVLLSSSRFEILMVTP